MEITETDKHKIIDACDFMFKALGYIDVICIQKFTNIPIEIVEIYVKNNYEKTGCEFQYKPKMERNNGN